MNPPASVNSRPSRWPQSLSAIAFSDQLCAASHAIGTWRDQRISMTAYATTVQPVRTRKDGRQFELVTPDFWVVACEHESGVLTRLTSSFWVRPSKQRGLEFHGPDASLWMPTWGESNSRLLRTSNGEDYENVPLLRPAFEGFDWALALVDLAEAIRDGRRHRMSAEHAAHVVDVLNAADRSRAEGGAIAIESDFDPPPPLDWAR